MIGVPLWLLWIVSAAASTYRRAWHWNPTRRCIEACHGDAFEFVNCSVERSHVDPWTKEAHAACASWPCVTVYYRIQLWPPRFIERPEISIFDSWNCMSPPPPSPVGGPVFRIPPEKRANERFAVQVIR